jgi:protein TonB
LTAISFPDGTRLGNLPVLRGAVPSDYPEAAMARRVQGTVVLEATIEKDGHVDNISVVSGPVELRQASIDVESQCLHQPLEVLGEARAVKVQIEVIFAIG